MTTSDSVGDELGEEDVGSSVNFTGELVGKAIPKLCCIDEQNDLVCCEKGTRREFLKCECILLTIHKEWAHQLAVVKRRGEYVSTKTEDNILHKDSGGQYKVYVNSLLMSTANLWVMYWVQTMVD